MVYFRCRYQGLFNLLTFCVLLGLAAVWSCSESENRNELAPVFTAETTQPITRETVAEVLADVEKNAVAIELNAQLAPMKMEPEQRPPTFAETMAALRLEFPGNVLDDDFTRIQEIINSDTYLEFLERTYPLENPFQDFDEFWASAAVDTERYLELLNIYFKPPIPEATGADVSVLHYMTSRQRNLNARKFHGEDQGPEGLMDMMKSDTVFAWIEQRFINTDGSVNVLLWVKVFAHHGFWVKQLQEEDREKIHDLFVEHGTQKGFLRVALQEPVCLGYLLKDFTDVQVFKKWVDGEFSVKK